MGALELRLPYRTVKARPFPGLAVGLSLLPSLTAALLVFGPPPWRGEVGVLVGLTLLAHLLAHLHPARPPPPQVRMTAAWCSWVSR